MRLIIETKLVTKQTERKNDIEFQFIDPVILRNRKQVTMSLRNTLTMLTENQSALANSGAVLEDDQHLIDV